MGPTQDSEEETALACTILIIDSYQSDPCPELDTTFSSATKTQLKQVPVLRVFGIESGGKKCCVHIHRIYPYLCVRFETSPDERRKSAFVESLEKALNAHSKVARHRIVEATFFKGKNYYGYHRDEEVFLKISFSDPRTVKRASEVLNSGQVLGSALRVFEAHTPFPLQFMIDHQVQGMNSLRIGKYTRRTPGHGPPKQTCCEMEIDIFIEDVLNQFEEQDMNPGLRAIWQDPRLREVANSETTVIERELVPSERELSYRALLMKFLGVDDILSQRSTPVPSEPDEEQSELQDTLLEAAEGLLFGETDSILFPGPSAEDGDDMESHEMSQVISEDILNEQSKASPASTLFTDSGSVNTQVMNSQAFFDELEDLRTEEPENDMKESVAKRPRLESEDSDSSDMFSDEETLVEVPESDDETEQKPEPQRDIKTEEASQSYQPAPSAPQSNWFHDGATSNTQQDAKGATVEGCVKNEPESWQIPGPSSPRHQEFDIIDIDSSSSETIKPFQTWDVLSQLPQRIVCSETREALNWLSERRKPRPRKTGSKPNESVKKNTQSSGNDTLSQDLRFAYSLGDTPELCERHFELLTSLCCEVQCATRDNLKPDPSIDPLVAVVFVLHRDYPDESDDLQLKVIYDGCVEQTPLRRSLLSEVGGLASVELFKCNGELDIIRRVSEVVVKWDPDIVLGYETDTLSWGYLIERCLALDLNPKMLFSRVAIEMPFEEPGQPQTVELPPGVRFDQDKERYFESWDYRITGRVLLNTWRMMRKEIALTNYSFENVYYHILHRREHVVSHGTLRSWYEDPLQMSRCISYLARRCAGCFHLIEKLEIYTKTCEMARIYGIQFYEVLSRGSQFRVESMMLRSTRKSGYIAFSPTVLDRSLQRSPEWIPLVMEPYSNFYMDPLVILDFQSLYPSLMIAYNYCFSTCFGKVQDIIKGSGSIKFGCADLAVDVEELKRLKDDIIISPSGSVFVKSHIRRGILPRLVEEIINTRFMVKKGMKKSTSKSFNRILDARQLGLKLISNVTYGYTSASFSGRMPLVELADAIVSKGKESLETAVKLVNTNEAWGAEVVYGDTDSMFILLRGRTKNEAFKIGYDIAEKVSAMFPDPMKLKFEKVYYPSVLETKKRYFGYMYETEDQLEPVLDAKGIELIRRDGCKVQQVILDKAIRTLFDTKDFQSVKKVVQKSFEQIFKGKFGLHRFVFAKEYNGATYYQQNSCVPVLKIARQLKSEDPRAEPLVGERVPYIVTQGWDKARIIDLVAHPKRLLEDYRLRPNYTYYILRIVCPALDRALLKVHTADWYHELPKIMRITPIKEGAKKTMVYEYFDVNRCAVCDKPGQCTDRVCDVCRTRPQSSVFISLEKLRRHEEDLKMIRDLCKRCMTNRETNVDECISINCPILYRRIALREKYDAAQELSLIQYMF